MTDFEASVLAEVKESSRKGFWPVHRRDWLNLLQKV